MKEDILIVEDDPELRETLESILAEEGYALASVHNGLEAIERLKAGARPSLILLDLTMPIVNGWEFRLFQQRDEALARIPVIIITAGSTPREELEWMGPTDLLQKPIDLQHLLESVRRHCLPASSTA